MASSTTVFYMAHPTLRGLVRTPKVGEARQKPVLYRWQDVDRDRGSRKPFVWKVFGREGEPLREDGREVRLQLASRHSHHIAQLAQRRHFQQVWRNGTLDMGVQCSKVFPEFLVLLLLTLLVLVPISVKAVPWAVHVLQENSSLSLPLSQRVLWIVMIALGASIVFGAVVLQPISWAYGMLRYRHIRQVRFTNKGLHVSYANGTDRFEPWEGLEGIRGGMFIRFRFYSGLNVVVHLAYDRVLTALQANNWMRKPEEVVVDRQGCRWQIVRMAAIWMVCSTGLVWVTHVIPYATPLPLYMVLVFWAVVPVFIGWVYAMRWTARRGAMKQRRRSQAARRKAGETA